MVFVQIRKSLANRNPARIPKADKDFAKRPEFRDIKFPVKTKTITKLKKRILLALVLLSMKIKKSIQSIN